MERDLSLLQLLLSFHSSLQVWPNSPIPIIHYFPDKIRKQKLVPCFHYPIFLTPATVVSPNSLIGDGGLISPNPPHPNPNPPHPNRPHTYLPASHPVMPSLKQLLKPHILRLLASRTQWYHSKCCWTTGLA